MSAANSTSREAHGAKILELESLRGLAALLVVFNHLPLWTKDVPGSVFVENGYLMVDFFFVLSGFVIYKNYQGRLRSSRDLLKFQFLRFGRLYPVHLLMLILFLVLEFSKFYLNAHTNLKTTVAVPFSINTPTAFFQHLFLLQSIGPTGNSLTYNAPAWSISVEFYTYFIFGIIALFARRKTLGAAALIAVVSAVLLYFYDIDSGYSEILRCFCGFFSGCCVAAFGSAFTKRTPASFSIIALLGLAAFLQFQNNGSFGAFIYFISAIVIYCVSSSKPGIVTRALNIRCLEWLGAISYSLYMSHWLVIYLFDQILRHTFNFSVGAHHVLKMQALEARVLSVVAVGVCLLFAYIIYVFVEAPFRTKSRQVVLIDPS